MQGQMIGAAAGYSNSLGGSYMAQDACKLGAEPRQAELPAQMERINKSLAYAEESLRELLSRMEPTMRPQPPEPTGQGAMVSVATGYGIELHGFGTRIATLADRIQDALRRLEL
jgi:hypothetical protein